MSEIKVPYLLVSEMARAPNRPPMYALWLIGHNHFSLTLASDSSMDKILKSAATHAEALDLNIVKVL